MLVPNALFSAAWKRAAPWMPPKVEPLQLSVTRAFLVGRGRELLERRVHLLRKGDVRQAERQRNRGREARQKHRFHDHHLRPLDIIGKLVRKSPSGIGPR